MTFFAKNCFVLIFCISISSISFGQSSFILQHYPDHYNKIDELSWQSTKDELSIIESKDFFDKGLPKGKSLHLQFTLARLKSIEWGKGSSKKDFVNYLIDLGDVFINTNKNYINRGKLKEDSENESFYLSNNILVVIGQILLKIEPEVGCKFISKVWEDFNLSKIESNLYLGNLRLGLITVIGNFYESDFIPEISYNLLYENNDSELPTYEKKILLNAYYKSKINILPDQKEIINFSLLFLEQNYGLNNMIKEGKSKWNYMNYFLFKHGELININDLFNKAENTENVYKKYLLLQSVCYFLTSDKIKEKTSKRTLRKLKSSANLFIEDNNSILELNGKSLLESALKKL